MGQSSLWVSGEFCPFNVVCVLRVEGALGPEYCALAHLFEGEIWLDILYLDSDMRPEKASQIADEIRGILESAFVGIGQRKSSNGQKQESAQRATH